MADFGPVRITSHGRTELVVLNPNEFERIASGESSDANRLAGKLAIVLDSIDIAVLIFDEGLYVRRVNPAMCQLVDSDEDRIIGIHASALETHPSHRYTISRLAEVHRSGCAEVLTATSARDPTRTLQIKLKPWPNGVALFAEDITDRMRFGDKIVTEGMMDRSLAALDGIGTAQVRSCGTILSTSAGLTQMAGASAAALAGARLQNLVSPQFRAVINDALLGATDEPRRYQIEYLRKGVSAAPATMVITSYWTAEHHACAAVALHDRNWSAG